MKKDYALPLEEARDLNFLQILGKFFMRKSPSGYPYLVFCSEFPIPEIEICGILVHDDNRVTKAVKPVDFDIIDKWYDWFWSNGIICFIVETYYYNKRGHLNKVYRRIYRDCSEINFRKW